MVFPGSWTFSWFLRWSLRRNALWQTSQRKVFVWLWIRMCLFSLNFDVNFLSQSGKSKIKTYFVQFVDRHLESCTQMEFLRCESIHAACNQNVVKSSTSSKLFVQMIWGFNFEDYCAMLLHFGAVCKKAMWHDTFMLATLYDAILQHTFPTNVVKYFQSCLSVNAICTICTNCNQCSSK